MNPQRFKTISNHQIELDSETYNWLFTAAFWKSMACK